MIVTLRLGARSITAVSGFAPSAMMTSTRRNPCVNADEAGGPIRRASPLLKARPPRPTTSTTSTSMT